jgi:hypothetical protein
MVALVAIVVLLGYQGCMTLFVSCELADLVGNWQ